MNDGPIKRPQWLEAAVTEIDTSYRLYREKKMPPHIETFMIVTPLKHALRGVYGKDNLGIAWILLKQAIANKIQYAWWGLLIKLGLDKETLI